MHFLVQMGAARPPSCAWPLAFCILTQAKSWLLAHPLWLDERM